MGGVFGNIAKSVGGGGSVLGGVGNATVKDDQDLPLPNRYPGVTTPGALTPDVAPPKFDVGGAVKGVAAGATAGLAKRDADKARIAQSGRPVDFSPLMQQPNVDVGDGSDYLTAARSRFGRRGSFYGG